MENVKQAQARDFTADRATCDAVNEGPWYLEQPYGHGHAFVVSNNEGNDVILAETSEVCARFIVEARTGWPAALDEIERLQRVVEHHRRMAEISDYHYEKRKAEIQRYRQALESIVNMTFNIGYIKACDLRKIAKEALNRGE